MTEEQARSNAEALASALGITFFVVRSRDNRFEAVQLPAPESEIVARIEPPDPKRSFDDAPGFR
jgi:hypothetical protein